MKLITLFCLVLFSAQSFAYDTSCLSEKGEFVHLVGDNGQTLVDNTGHTSIWLKMINGRTLIYRPSQRLNNSQQSGYILLKRRRGKDYFSSVDDTSLHRVYVECDASTVLLRIAPNAYDYYQILSDED